MKCQKCKSDTDDMYVVAVRDDGTWYERRDGSFGTNDLYVCIDCLAELVDA